MSTIQEIKSLTDTIPRFNGNSKQLSYFISRVEETNTLINSCTPAVSETLKRIAFINVKSKLCDKAAEVVQEQTFENWQALKTFLINKFSNKQTSHSILLDIMYKRCNKNPIDFVNEIMELYALYKQKLTLENNNAPIIYSQNEKLVVLHTIISLRDPLRNNLATRNPQTLNELDSLLRNDFQYLKISNFNQNITVNKIKALPDKHNIQSDNTKKHFSNNYNNNYRQNNYNGTKNHYVSTPMSTSTKQTRTPDNYFTRNKSNQATNWIAKELHNNDQLKDEEIDEEQEELYEEDEEVTYEQAETVSNPYFLEMDPEIEEKS